MNPSTSTPDPQATSASPAPSSTARDPLSGPPPGAERISKERTWSHVTAYRASAVFMGVPFVLIGTYFALVGFGALPLPSKANAPLWVIGCIGVAFTLAGAMVGASGVRGVLNRDCVTGGRT